MGLLHGIHLASELSNYIKYYAERGGLTIGDLLLDFATLLLEMLAGAVGFCALVMIYAACKALYERHFGKN